MSAQPISATLLAGVCLAIAAPSSVAELVDITPTAAASQSTEWNGGQFPAALAIDGDPDTFSHTDGPTPNNFLQLRFDTEQPVARVELWMRADCCPGRMQNATLRLSDAEGDSVFDATIDDPGQGALVAFDLPHATYAQRLRVGFENGVTNPGLPFDYVHLGEVRVLADVAPLPHIETFEATPVAVSGGETATLSWNVLSSDTVVLTGFGEVAAEGSRVVTPAGSTCYTLSATNARGTVSAKVVVLVDADLLPPRINEFMASNRETLIAADGSSPDWVELWNPNPVPLELEGYGLSDDPARPGRFTFSAAAAIPAGGFLIVTAGELGFAFASEGGSFIGLTRPDGAPLQSIPYPAQRSDISYGYDAVDELVYLLAPTPGAANSGRGVEGFVADTKFSNGRGFYDAPVDVSISSATPAAQIYFTTDGSPPGADNPQAALYSAPLTIATPTVLRAAAFKDGYQPTDIDTHSYLFPQQVADQPAQPPGMPAAWVSDFTGVVSPVPAPSHFTMAASVVGAAPFVDAGGQSFDLADALKDIPTLSLAITPDELFDPVDGLHANAQQRGRGWEREASVELIDPATGETHQANCGLRMHGGWNRYPEMLKKTFRLYFRAEYGDAKFAHPLFERGASETFDRLILRSGNGKAWPSPWRSPGALQRVLYLRDQLVRELQADMGHDHVAGSFAHLYINGLYWGLYNPVERPGDHFGSEHFGGSDSDYDALKWIRGTGHVVAAGSDESWNQLIALVRGETSDPAVYAAVGELLDLTNLADYILLNYFAGNVDWVDSNTYALRNRGGDGRWRFYCWDSEETFSSAGADSTNYNVSDTSTELHHRLRANPDYRLLFADRAQQHLFRNGALTPSQTIPRISALAGVIDRAIVGESARWGGLLRPADPYDRQDWLNELNNLRNNFLPPRGGVVLGQLRADGLYPPHAAPVFSPQHGGAVAEGFQLVLSSPDRSRGVVYYTVDGSDPRAPGGGLSASAIAFPAEAAQTLSPVDAEWRYLDTGALELGGSDIVDGHPTYGPDNWKHPAFDDTAWAVGAAPLGYGTVGDATIRTAVGFGGDPIDKHVTTYFRREFDLPLPQDRAAALRLRLMRDDGAVIYLNGHELLRSNFPAGTTTVGPTTLAVGVAGDSESEFHQFDLPPTALAAGSNTLAVELHQASANSSDLGFELELIAFIQPETAPLVEITQDAFIRARVLDEGGEWSALEQALYLVGDRATDLFVSELMYHPGGGKPAEAEFIEIANRGTSSHRLDDLRVNGGVEFEFADGAILELGAGERLLLVRDHDIFVASYPNAPQAAIAGQYRGALDNAGDSFALVDGAGTVLWTLTYGDDDAWPGGTDGDGHSLTFVSGDLNAPSSWRPSVQAGGSPGGSDRVALVGNDLLAYADIADLTVEINGQAPTLTANLALGRDDAVVTAEWSPDLERWHAAALRALPDQPLGGGRAQRSWLLTQPPGSGPILFRIVVTKAVP